MKQNGFKFQTMASQSCDPQTASRLRAPGETGASVAVALDLLLFLLFLTIALSEMKIKKLGQKGHAFQESVAKERVFLRSSWTLSPPSGRTESRKRVLTLSTRLHFLPSPWRQWRRGSSSAPVPRATGDDSEE